MDKIHNKLNFDLNKDIYFKLFNKYKYAISDNTTKFICEYIVKNKNNDINILLNFCQNFQFLIPNILNCIKEEDYILKEDFLEIKENYRIKLFKGLVEKAGISKEKYGEDLKYVNKSFEVITELEEELNSNKVLYKDI